MASMASAIASVGLNNDDRFEEGGAHYVASREVVPDDVQVGIMPSLPRKLLFCVHLTLVRVNRLRWTAHMRGRNSESSRSIDECCRHRAYFSSARSIHRARRTNFTSLLTGMIRTRPRKSFAWNMWITSSVSFGNCSQSVHRSSCGA